MSSPEEGKKKDKDEEADVIMEYNNKYGAEDFDDATTTSETSETEEEATRRAKICKFVLDMMLFYTTAFFVLLAVFSAFALIFLVPFFIDPAWSTLQADFDVDGATCKTVSGVYLEGQYVFCFKTIIRLNLHIHFFNFSLSLPYLFLFFLAQAHVSVVHPLAH